MVDFTHWADRVGVCYTCGLPDVASNARKINDWHVVFEREFQFGKNVLNPGARRCGQLLARGEGSLTGNLALCVPVGILYLERGAALQSVGPRRAGMAGKWRWCGPFCLCRQSYVCRTRFSAHPACVASTRRSAGSAWGKNIFTTWLKAASFAPGSRRAVGAPAVRRRRSGWVCWSGNYWKGVLRPLGRHILAGRKFHRQSPGVSRRKKRLEDSWDPHRKARAGTICVVGGRGHEWTYSARTIVAPAGLAGRGPRKTWTVRLCSTARPANARGAKSGGECSAMNPK